jgi:hypothetical protein
MFSNIFQQGTISSSAYNAFQASLEKRFSRTGCNFTAAYTFGKSLDYASTFESLVNPFNPRIGRSPSLFDARIDLCSVTTGICRYRSMKASQVKF